MTLPQAKFREIVFQLLYSRNCSGASDDDMIPLIMKELAVTKSTVREALEKVERILAQQGKIDEAIAKTSLSYTFQRIQSVELNILRLGTFELLYDDNIPPLVAISEAMRLARKFGSPESASFVNAILDNLYKSMQGEQVDSAIIEKSLAIMEENETLSQKGHEMREKEKLL
jgi:N utilization substance protein B